MSIKVTGEITLNDIIPLIEHLNAIEQEELRQFLEARPKINWQHEWEKVVTCFQSIFKQFPEAEIEADFNIKLKERAKCQS